MNFPRVKRLTPCHENLVTVIFSLSRLTQSPCKNSPVPPSPFTTPQVQSFLVNW